MGTSSSWHAILSLPTVDWSRVEPRLWHKGLRHKGLGVDSQTLKVVLDIGSIPRSISHCLTIEHKKIILLSHNIIITMSWRPHPNYRVLLYNILIPPLTYLWCLKYRLPEIYCVHLSLDYLLHHSSVSVNGHTGDKRGGCHMGLHVILIKRHVIRVSLRLIGDIRYEVYSWESFLTVAVRTCSLALLWA